MKKLLLNILLCLSTGVAMAQLNTGDLSFVGFNADGNDDLAFVTFVDIPANTLVFFSDKEWDGSAFTDGENSFYWESGSTIIPAGTIVVFNNLSNSSSISATIGTLSGGTALGNSDEAVWVYNATTADPLLPTGFITVIANDPNSYGVLTNTGLTDGTTALTLTSSTDIGEYIGTRTGLTVDAYRTAINDMSNWVVQNASGDQSLDGTNPDLPFNTTAFTFGTTGGGEDLPEIEFAQEAYPVMEDAGTATVVLELSDAYTSDITVDIALSVGTATPGADFTFVNQTITILAGSTSATISVPVINDAIAEADEVITLTLSNPVNAELGGDIATGIFILDNDTTLFYPASPSLDINYATSYLVDANGSAEISAYDPATQRLFVMNSTQTKVEILDFSDITNISTISTIDLSAYGTDGSTSIAVKNGLVAATVSNGPTANGVVVFMDTNGANVSSVTVGNLPDNVSFTPDGTKVLTANEGQPNDDYTIDPEGSISVIDVTGGLGNITQANVTTLNFNAFDTQLTQLLSDGVRIFGPNATVSQDLEPEYITYASDSQTAWVSLQENNALGVIDLSTMAITDIIPLGVKNYGLAGNTLDASDKTDFIYMGNWPNVYGEYMPDAIASYEVAGVTYVVTANEGDSRDYGGYSEEARIKDNDYILDPTIFPYAELLKKDETIGRLKVTIASGDVDNDGDYDEIHVYGGRSFSIWNTATGTQVYDSGDDFERYTANDATYGVLFNASNDNNEFKNRSDDKGPEPEGITVAEINGQYYAFITLERTGGLITYNITNPTAPEFVSYKNHRDLGSTEGGDLGPEGIIYIAPENSPNGMALIVMSNEVSATVSVYTINNVTYTTDAFTATEGVKMYPNPAKGNETIHFTEAISGNVYDMTGRKVLSFENTQSVQLPNLVKGTYVLAVKNGGSKKIIIE